ncbi:MAG: APC family permease, partial [Nocardioidaceae bacterium]
PYRLPAANILSPFAFFVANLIILWSGWDTDWKLGIAILLGYVILAVSRVFHLNERAVALNWRAASWLPVYLVGMGLITYMSTFGPKGWIPLWWDMAVVAAFSVVIYFWAMAVALSTEQIEAMISEVVLPEEEGLEQAPAH